MQNSTLQSNDEVTLRLKASLVRKSEGLSHLNNPRDFFSELANIYKFISSRNELVIILEEMLADYQKEFVETEKLRLQVEKELNQSLDEIKDIAIKNNLVTKSQWNEVKAYYENHMANPVIPDLLKNQDSPSSLGITIGEYYSVAYGSTQAMSEDVTRERMLLVYLGRIVATIFSKNPELVKRYVILFKDDKGQEVIQDYKISTTYREFENKRALATVKSQISPWFAFSRLQLVPLCMYDYVEYMARLKEQNDIVRSMNLNLLVGEMRNILGNKQTYSNQPTIFVVQDYKNYFLRVIDHILDYLDFTSEETKEKITPLQITPSQSQNIKSPSLPQFLPQDDLDSLFLAKFSFNPEPQKGKYFLRYGSHIPATFDMNSDLGNVCYALAKKIGGWVHAQEIVSQAWPKINYEAETSEKGKKLHKKVRDTISDIRIKKLVPHGLADAIVIQSGYDLIGDKGSNWFRFMLIAP